MNRLTKIEIILFIGTLIFGVLWWMVPDGNYEPVAFLALLLGTTGVEFYKRFSNTTELNFGIVDSNNIEPDTIVDTNDQLPSFNYTNSCTFFYERFSYAFPGIRTPTWFKGSQAVERLSILLEQPLKFSRDEGGWVEPVYWLRDGNCQFSDFRVINKSTVIIDCKELKIKKICAGYMQKYKQLFVYIESEQMPATGLYNQTPAKIQAAVDNFGYAWEEYALYMNDIQVTREAYDDNAAVLMGKPTRLDGKTELRVRYLTPYNMVICASESPLNQPKFDVQLEDYLNRLLKGDECMDEFINEIKNLPITSAF